MSSHWSKESFQVGITATHHHLPDSSTAADISARIGELNADPTVHGIILQLPLDVTTPVDADAVMEEIAAEKDVDGLTLLNAGRLARNHKDAIVPCTPKGCLRLVQKTGTSV